MGSSIINSSLDDQLHREDSFSFTGCFDFNSAPSVFSEDDDYASADDDASYIEIALDNDGDGGDDSGEFELRISLSTSATKTQQNYPAAFETDHTTTPSSSSSTFTFSCSSSRARSLAGAPSEIGKEKLIDINQWELLRSRKTSKSTNTMAMNGGFTRWFIVKFQAMKVRNLLASVAKPLQVISSQGNSGGSTTDQHKKKRSKEITQYYQRLIKPFDKWIDQRSNQGNRVYRDIKNSLRGGVGGDQRYSRVLEINLDPIRGVLEAVSMGMGIGRKDRRTRSCPTSIESSPVHRDSFPSGSELHNHTGENSIEAAIAHCKTSFAQKPRFCP